MPVVYTWHSIVYSLLFTALQCRLADMTWHSTVYSLLVTALQCRLAEMWRRFVITELVPYLSSNIGWRIGTYTDGMAWVCWALTGRNNGLLSRTHTLLTRAYFPLTGQTWPSPVSWHIWYEYTHTYIYIGSHMLRPPPNQSRGDDAVFIRHVLSPCFPSIL